MTHAGRARSSPSWKTAMGSILNHIGQGQVLYVPADLFRDFTHNRYPMTRRFVGELVARLLPNPSIRVQAPNCIDVTLRQREDQVFIHLINRASGLPNLPNNGAIDEIPTVGPVSVAVQQPARPAGVRCGLEDGQVNWNWQDGTLTVNLNTVHIHTVIIIDV